MKNTGVKKQNQKGVMKNEKKILDRGYVTEALTNECGEIYGMNTTQLINWENNEVEKAHRFYWSEVYCEPDYMAIIIRKGRLICDASPKEMFNYVEQSKVNLNTDYNR